MAYNFISWQLRCIHQLPDHCSVEGPGFLSCGDDLLRGEQEAVGPGVPQLYGGRKINADLSVGPVNGAPASDVEKTGNAADVVSFTMDGLQGSLATNCDLQQLVVVVRRGTGVSPGQQDQLAVAVEAVVE